MRLDRVDIKNFRSIKEMTFTFDPSFRILIGKNESGKTNIIKALSLLSPEINPTIDDKREFLSEEKVDKEYYVRFVFKLDPYEIKHIYNVVSKETLCKPKTKIIKVTNRELTLMEYIERIAAEGIYRVNINTKTKDFTYWKIPEANKFLPQVRKHKNYTKKGAEDQLSIFNTIFLCLDEIADAKEDDYLSPSLSEPNEIIIENLRQIVLNNLPSVILWKYDEANLLPSRVNISSFSANPDSCIPLKILFNLAGYENIQVSIDEALKSSGNQFDNLLQRVSAHATKHFREVWKEYPKISFSFTHNGDNIISAIQEENKYPLAQRSDGFKRFVTFLILISACTKTHDLLDNLLLFDEPDISLHPSGIRYLRDEMIRVSSDNIVIAATHSIFMIDNECIDRHVIVTKQKEQTNINTPVEIGLAQEEILFKAVGFSLYEILQSKNIVFEGWRDKHLFKIAIASLPTRYKSLKKDFQKIGICQSNGVKGMVSISPIFEAANRKCLIITDSDQPAKQRKAEYEKIKGFGVWFTYTEIDEKCHAVTGEDFIKKEHLLATITVFKKKHPEIVGEPDLSKESDGVLSSLNSWLTTKNQIQNVKLLLNEFKEMLFEDLTAHKIEDSYYLFLEELNKKLETI